MADLVCARCKSEGSIVHGRAIQFCMCSKGRQLKREWRDLRESFPRNTEDEVILDRDGKPMKCELAGPAMTLERFDAMHPEVLKDTDDLLGVAS